MGYEKAEINYCKKSNVVSPNKILIDRKGKVLEKFAMQTNCKQRSFHMQVTDAVF